MLAVHSTLSLTFWGEAFRSSAANISTFFTQLANGTVNPSIIWLAGTGASNDLHSAEGGTLTNNAAAINSFVGSGHGSGIDAYGWLTALLPGLSEVNGCSSSGATLTAAGIAAFPGLSNSNIDSNAGPCHSHFEGNFGGLTTLGLDGVGLSYIVGAAGGGGGSITEPPTGMPEPASLWLVGAGLAGLAAMCRRKTT